MPLQLESSRRSVASLNRSTSQNRRGVKALGKSQGTIAYTDGGEDQVGILKQVQSTVGAKSVHDISIKVSQLQSTVKKYKKYKELFDKLEGLVKEMTPPEEHSDPS